jgi:RNA polymerase sigma factor (sigma-70 family)
MENVDGVSSMADGPEPVSVDQPSTVNHQPPQEEGDFASLMQRARTGDKEAFAELVSRYEPEVRIVVRVLLGPALRQHLDSVDVVQSVHRSLLRGLRAEAISSDTPQQLIGLAVQMARRKVARKWRRTRRQETVAGGNHDSLPDFLAGLVTPELDPARTAQLNDAVNRLYDGLSETDRGVMELRMQGYSTAEAARLLDVDPDSLRVRLSRLRQQLRASGLFDDWL